MNRIKEMEDIIKDDILHKERRVRDATVTVHIMGSRPHEELIAEILSVQHKYEKFPQLKQSTYHHHQCIRGGPPSKKSSKHIGCKAYITFKKLTHPMGGNILVVTEKDVHTGHDPNSPEESIYHTTPKKRKLQEPGRGVTQLIEKGWAEKVIYKGSGIFHMPMECNEDKSYTLFFPELSCSCRVGKKRLFCRHLELLMKLQEEKRIENLNDLMMEEARNILKEEHPRYNILSQESGEVSVFVASHKISVQCSLASNSCTCTAYTYAGVCVHLHLASILLPEFRTKSHVTDDGTYSNIIMEEVSYGNSAPQEVYGNVVTEEDHYNTETEEVIFNTSQTSDSYIAKLKDVIHYLEAASPSQEMATLIDELYNHVKDSFVYVLPVDSE
ncbi:uncharacterized protein LOC135215663 [Macrobrachium nipponense]|uniref:uncharacterized protein LOC135215663 n=1 Tax=Macrobrachium nipponense TaxID=159736 RepID=UPI0030C843E1